MWHAHFNESGAPAHLIPIQDAGLQTYLRTLDIRFCDRREHYSISNGMLTSSEVPSPG